MVLRIFGCWLFAAIAWACIEPASATPPAAGGVYAIIDAASPAQYDLAEEVLKRPDVDGLLIHLRWVDVNPAHKTYKWEALNATIRLVMRANKRFEIGIVTGSAAPQWVINGSAHAAFSYDAAMGKGCSELTLAAPYDPFYLQSFHELLRALGRDLRDHGTYDHLAMIKLSGITTTTDELRLPAVTPCKGGEAPVTTWLRLGYLPQKVHHAWREMLRMYLEEFPQVSFNLGFIGINAFPAIRKDKTTAPPDQADGVSVRFTEELIGEAAAAMPGRLALGFDLLTLHGMNKSYGTYLLAFYHAAREAGGLPLGWQTNELLDNYPKGGAACSGSTPSDRTPCASSQEFEAMLFAGLGMNLPPGMAAVYLELFPQNIVLYPSATAPARRGLTPWCEGAQR